MVLLRQLSCDGAPDKSGRARDKDLHRASFGQSDAEAFDRISSEPPTSKAAFVFSRDQKTIDRFIGELSYGGGAVNQVNIHLFIESMPFGGTGAAGIGHYYGKYGFDMLTHAKSMLIAPPEVAIDHLFPPYTKAKNEALTLWFEY